ncbi:unnamed protein product [Albugo candida]|uniref:Uncharacterized protein n=1 Tax=Albugo candida TaxID=65357 RepID=A0A024FZJ5_9STRA|nr:unnamed protein product [Albugo candida]|eukprot:CCI39475.1 unnamed protein product [Albugo candida]
MDLSGFMRRMSGGEEQHSSSIGSFGAFTDSTNLVLDTKMQKKLSNDASEPQWNDDDSHGSPIASSLGSAPDIDAKMLRRGRSNSECLFLAKSRGPNDLPGPCKEYISNVKQILAKSDNNIPSGHSTLARRNSVDARRRRSMSLRNSPAFRESVIR